MGAADRAKQKVRTRAEDFIASAPVPQERILVGAQVISGLSRKWALLSPGAKLLGRTYYLALTDQHLLFCWISAWSGKPAEVSIVAPREQVKVISSRLGGQMGWIVCQVPGREGRMTLRFHRFWRSEVESLLSALPADGVTGSDSRQ